MVIVKILGGFASQLRHYGVGYLLAKSKNTELYLDLSDYVEGYFRPFMLSYVTVPDCFILRNKSILNKVVRVRDGKHLIELFEEDDFPDVYLGGETADYKEFYEKYPLQYPGVDFEVFKTLKLKFESPFLKDFKKKLEEHQGIGVHVRLGDFSALGVADSIEKYKGAIGWILKQKPDYSVYFFSNDVSEAAKLFGNDSHFHYIDYQNGYLGDVEEFFALSMCREKIIATRSGYSRYAAYLGMNQYGSNRAVCLEDLDGMSEEFQFLDEVQLREGRVYYKNASLINVPEKSDSAKFTSENGETLNDIANDMVNDINEIASSKYSLIGKEYQTEIRYDTVCWNSILKDKESETKFWRKYYGISDHRKTDDLDKDCVHNTSLSATLKNRLRKDQPSNNMVYIFKTMRKYNRWYAGGLYLKALICARIGYNVLYVCKNDNDSFGMKVDEIDRAKDMDGRDLGFDILILDKANENAQIDAWIKTQDIDYQTTFRKKIIRDTMPLIIKDSFQRLINKISSHQFDDDCRYLPNRLSDFEDNLWYINEMLEKRLH